MFEELGQADGVAEAYSDLALCYWREGAFDEARVNLEAAFERWAIRVAT
jgi:Flp pilus assembly protein TadD